MEQQVHIRIPPTSPPWQPAQIDRYNLLSLWNLPFAYSSLLLCDCTLVYTPYWAAGCIAVVAQGEGQTGCAIYLCCHRQTPSRGLNFRRGFRRRGADCPSRQCTPHLSAYRHVSWIPKVSGYIREQSVVDSVGQIRYIGTADTSAADVDTAVQDHLRGMLPAPTAQRPYNVRHPRISAS